MAARGVNQVNLMGRLTRDPEVRQTTTGKAVASFSIAVDRSGSEDTDFFDVTAWQQLAEIVSKFTQKGSKVYVTGRLQLDRWESDGQKKSRVSVVANDVIFLDPAGQANNSESTTKNGFDTGDKSIQERQKEVGTLNDEPINLDDIPF